MENKDDKTPQNFSQEGIPSIEKTLEDFFQIRGGVLNLIGILQTSNFINGVRGVQIQSAGLNSTGGNIQGATVGGTVITVPNGGTGASTLTGILLGNGAAKVTTVAGVSGSFYVANSSGGSPTHLVTVTNGVIVSIA